MMGTPFETLPKEEQQDWRDGYDKYVARIEDAKKIGENITSRPFNIWITDFGFTHK